MFRFMFFHCIIYAVFDFVITYFPKFLYSAPSIIGRISSALRLKIRLRTTRLEIPQRFSRQAEIQYEKNVPTRLKLIIWLCGILDKINSSRNYHVFSFLISYKTLTMTYVFELFRI